MRSLLPILTLAALVLAPPFAHSAEIDPYDQSQVPLEVDSTDPSLTKIVLVAGRKSHGPGDHEFFAGCAILMDMLKQTPGVFPVMVRDGWPKNEEVLKGAKSLVFYMDGRGGHPVNKKLDVLQPLIDQGVGWVNIHYAVDYTKETGARVIDWLGGYYDAEISTNPHWVANYSVLPDHPISRGVKPFEIKDEWYFNMRWRSDPAGLTNILKATPPDGVRGTPDAKAHAGRSEVTAWAFERANQGRSFGFTGGHTHKNWANDDFRRLVVNAILWSAKVEVPKDGAPCVLAPGAIERNLDDKRKK
jgi:type 1 glutamine amidotransferase